MGIAYTTINQFINYVDLILEGWLEFSIYSVISDEWLYFRVITCDLRLVILFSVV